MADCDQEMCPMWDGEGHPRVAFGLRPTVSADLVSLKAIGHWAAVQFASICCLVHAVFLLMCGITRHAFGASTAAYVPHMLLLAALFYGLHWRLQSRAHDLDFARSDRIVSAMKMRPSRLDPDW